MAFVSGFVGAKVRGVDRALCGRAAVRAEWTSVGTKEELMANGGKKVVKLGPGKILIKEFAGDVYAVSNNCPHLSLPLEGKIMKASYSDKGEITCSAHKTTFDLKTGCVVGEWCPGMPNLPFVGKGKEQADLPTFEVKMEGDEIMVNA